MRWYDIASEIFLILCIIDSTLTGPVPVHEAHEAHVRIDAVDIPNDMITVFGKRMDNSEDFNKFSELLNKHFKEFRKPLELLDTHGSSSAPPRHDHGPTNDVKAPTVSAASSTGSSPIFDWNDGTNFEDWPPAKLPKLAPSKEVGQVHEDQAQQPKPGPLAGPDDPPPSGPAPPNKIGLAPLRPTINSDGHPNLMAAEPSPTEVNSYLYPTWEVPPSPGARLPTVSGPENEKPPPSPNSRGTF